MPVTRRQAAKMKATEEPYPTTKTRVSASKDKQKLIPPQEELRGLKRRDIQELAKRHRIKANRTTAHIIDALLRIRAQQFSDSDIGSLSTGRSRRHGHRQDSESLEIRPVASSLRLPRPDDAALEQHCNSLTGTTVGELPRQTSNERVEEFLASLDLPYTASKPRNELVETFESGAEKPQSTRFKRAAATAPYPASPLERQRVAKAHRQANTRSTHLTITLPPAVRATQPTNRHLLSILSELRPEEHRDSQLDPDSLPPRMKRPTNRDLLEMHRQLQPLLEQRRHYLEALVRAERALVDATNQLEGLQQKWEGLEKKQQVYHNVLFPKLKELTDLRHDSNAEWNEVPAWRQFLAVLVDGEGEDRDKDGDEGSELALSYASSK